MKNTLLIILISLIAGYCMRWIIEVKRIDNNITISSDTLHKSDTIWPDTVFIPFAQNIFVPQRVNDSVTTYRDTYKDQNVEIIITDTTKNDTVNRKVDYRLFVPERITDTIIINNQTTINNQIKYKKYMSLGILNDFNSGKGFQLEGGIYIKRYAIGIGYARYKNQDVFSIKTTINF